MATVKQKSNTVLTIRKTAKKKRSGVHSKKKSAKLKSSKNYVKIYKGQGR